MCSKCDGKNRGRQREDRCGPKVVNWKTWVLAKLVPDDLWGVDVSPACEAHDLVYERGGGEAEKKLGDEDFKDDMFHLLYEGGVSYLKSTLASELYYLGVHISGEEYFNWTS